MGDPRRLGHVPDSPSDDDWDFGDLLGAIGPEQVVVPPSRASLRDHCPGVLQQDLEDCICNAGFQGVRTRHSLEGIANPELGARLPAYYLVRGYIGTTEQDSGGQIRDFFRALNKYGFASERRFPYLTSNFREPPPPEFFSRALDQRSPTKYWRITSTGELRVDQVKRAIASGFPIIFGIRVAQSFRDWGGKGVIQPPEATDQIVGGHAMCALEYDAHSLGGPNSWGNLWGAEGYFRLSWDYVARAIDMWVIEAAPYYSEVQP